MCNQNFANIPLHILRTLSVITASIVITRENPQDKYNGNLANRKLSTAQEE